MTDRLREAATAALAAIEDSGHKADLMAAAESLRAALAEPVPEAVAWMDREGDIYPMPERKGWAPPHTFLYAHPTTTPASPDEDVKVVRLTREQHSALMGLFEIADDHTDEYIGDVVELFDWPAQEGR